MARNKAGQIHDSQKLASRFWEALYTNGADKTRLAGLAVMYSSPTSPSGDLALLTPECLGGQLRPLHQRPELGPGDLGVHLVRPRIGAKAAIDPGDDVLAP